MTFDIKILKIKDFVEVYVKPRAQWDNTIIIAQKAVPHVINSRALTGEKLYINKAIHALLIHGYATFNMIVPGPQICCHYEMCTARP